MKTRFPKISLRSWPHAQPCALLAIGLSSLGALGQTAANPSALAQALQQQTPLTGTSAAAPLSGPTTIALEGISQVKLTPGCVLDLKVFEEPDLDGQYSVDGNGQILLPLVGSIPVEGMTLKQAQDAIAAKFERAEILTKPNITLGLSQVAAKDIVVTGEVASPGRYPSLIPRKLVDVLAMAGGETQLAGDEISIHRDGHPESDLQFVHYDRLQKDAATSTEEIDPGDTLTVKRAGVVYVLGAVNRPGGYVMQEAGKITLPEALALAYGTAPQAAISSIRIMRKVANGYVEIPANYAKYEKGKALPLPLQAEDVVYVPSSLARNILISSKDAISGVGGASIYLAR